MKALKVNFVLFPILSLLVFVSAVQAQGIVTTKHNLTATGSGDVKTSGTTEICVFCHTPHGADAAVAAPLWNRAQPAGPFTMYTSPTLDATTGTAPTGTSLACLSCHDGTVAFDALRNLPGAGLFTENPNPAGETTWTFGASTDKKMPTGRITNLGPDLSNDHPISMVYGDARSPSSTSADGTLGIRPANTAIAGKKCVLPGASTGDCNSADALPLSRGGVSTGPDYVQCTSCHDPHRSDTPTFLRVSNNGSALCLTCHVKDG